MSEAEEYEVPEDTMQQVYDLTGDLVSACKLIYSGLMAREAGSETSVDIIASSLVNASVSLALASIEFAMMNGCDPSAVDDLKTKMAGVILRGEWGGEGVNVYTKH